MRLRIVSAALAALALATISCSEHTVTGPRGAESVRLDVTPAVLPAVRISEFHYDNTGTDVGEAIEVSGPAGMDVTGWQVVLYNGNGGVTYNTQTLTGAIPVTCETRGVLVLNYPSNGIQNGGTTVSGTTEPDGIALIDQNGTVVEFLSYEGVVLATNGPAIGLSSTDIGIRELGSEAVGMSLQRNGDGTWTGPVASTFGACNDNEGEPPPVAEVASVTISPTTATISSGATQAFIATAFDSEDQPIAGVTFAWSTSDPSVATVNNNGIATGVAAGDADITATTNNGQFATASLHVNAASNELPEIRFTELHYDNFGTDAGESIEVEGPAGADLTGWSVVLYNGNGGVVYNTRALGGTIPTTCDTRGVVVLTYPQDGIQNGSPDGMALVDAGGQVVEFLSYEGTFTATDGPAAGRLSVDIGASQASSPVGQTLQRDSFNHWELLASTLGSCNGSGEPPPPPSNTISFSGRTPGDPALPVGFQDQLFATERDPNNVVIQTTVTWSSETPTVASIDQNGVMTALAAGTAVLRATTEDLTTATFSLPTRVGVASATAIYAGNAEFGEPTDANPADDFILRHAEYTTSFNVNRGTPNWVAYELDPTHYGPEDRCDCFTYDPALPESFPRYTTADYTGAGAFHGYGIDRGHLARSFDRTSASLDNAFTFLFSNIVPQAADLNQGPWAIMENFLGDQARFQNKEVYIIAGVAGNIGTIKNEGKIVIPAQTWKVALIMPHDEGLAQVHSYQDVEVIAVVMPNEPGVRNVDWHTYQVTVDSVEALSGYDLLALLPDPIEIAVESNTAPPVAAVDGPWSGFLPNETISMSGAGSTDADNDVLTYAWTFGDGATGTGVNVTHAYSAGGTYTVRLIVTDTQGLADTVTATATVLTPEQALTDAKSIVASLLSSGKIDAPTANSLNVKLDAAISSLRRGQISTAVAQLKSLLNQIDDLVARGVVSAADVAPLQSLVNRVIASVS
jgi:DNA/RNA endonuclease G (NUC1)